MKMLLMTTASALALLAANANAQNANCTCPQNSAETPVSADGNAGSLVRKQGGYGRLHAKSGNKPGFSDIRSKEGKQEYAQRYQRMMEGLDNDEDPMREEANPDINGGNMEVKSGSSQWSDIGSAQADPSAAGPVPGFDENDSGRKMTSETGSTGSRAWSDIGTARPDPSKAGPVPGFDEDDSGKRMTPDNGESIAGLADDNPVSRDDRPSRSPRDQESIAKRAVTSARAVLPSVSFDRWRIDTEDNRRTFEVAGIEEATGREYRVDVLHTGAVEEIEQIIPLAAVPADLRRKAGKTIRGMLVSETRRSLRPNMEVFYEFSGKLANGEQAYLSIRSDGRLINLVAN